MRLLLFLAVFPFCGLAQEINVGLGGYYYQQQFVTTDPDIAYAYVKDVYPAHYTGYSFNFEAAFRHKKLYVSVSYYLYTLHFYLQGHYEKPHIANNKSSNIDIDYNTRFWFNACQVTLGIDPLKKKFRLIPCLSIGRELMNPVREVTESQVAYSCYEDNGHDPYVHSYHNYIPVKYLVERDFSKPVFVFAPQLKFRYELNRHLAAGSDVGVRFNNHSPITFRNKKLGPSLFGGFQLVYTFGLKKTKPGVADQP